MTELIHVNSVNRTIKEHHTNDFIFNVTDGNHLIVHSKVDLWEVVLPKIKGTTIPFVYLHIDGMSNIAGTIQCTGLPIPTDTRGKPEQKYKSGLITSGRLSSGTMRITLTGPNNEGIDIDGDWGFTLRLLN